MNQIGFLGSQAEREESSRRPLPPDWIIRFDNGEAIAMEDARRHIGIFGSTGTGKTASCVYPIIYRHIELSHPVVLIDIKGVMRAKIRGMAKAAGREADYVEFGTSPTSTPLNIIEGISAAGFNTFLQGLISRAIGGKTGNMDFHFKGVRMATDCFRLLCWLAENDKAFTPTFTMISEMFAEPDQAAELFAHFAKRADLTEEQKQFIATVKGRRFHVLNQSAETQKKASTNHSEQCSYYTQMIDATLRELIESPGIAEKFCDPAACGVDFFDVFLRRKICVINFLPQTGPIGARLARHLLAAAYAAIYTMGPGFGNKLICVDEFHEVADLSSGRYSDSNFIALAREFDTSFVCATQSANALRAAGHDDPAVSAFISNLNTKVFFHTEDPFTRELAAAHDPDADLAALRPHEAFATWYDGSYKHGIQRLDQMYGYTREIKEMKGQLAQAVKVIKGEKAAGAPAAERCSPLSMKFEDLFDPGASIHVAAGHLSYVESMLRLFSDLGLGLRLKSLRMTAAGNIRAEAEGKPSEIEALNEWLQPTKFLCAKCGKVLPVKVIRRESGAIDVKKLVRSELVCDECMDMYLPYIQFPDAEPENARREDPGDDEEVGYPAF